MDNVTLTGEKRVEAPGALTTSPEGGAALRSTAEGKRLAAFRNNRASLAYRHRRIRRWNAVARLGDRWRTWGSYYHHRLTNVYRFLVPPGQRVLEIGCGKSDLLAAMEPSMGVGVDFAREAIRQASRRHAELRFVHADVHELELDETFDFIILSDLLNDIWDVQSALERLKPLCHPRTRVIMNIYSRLWELPLAMVERLGLAKPTLRQNWFAVHDAKNLLNLTGYEFLRNWQEILLPLDIPLVTGFTNRFVAKIWPVCHLCLTNFLIARPQPVRSEVPKEPRVSVIVAARNEEGNVPVIFARTPELGGGTELIFVEGGSKDNTYRAIEQAIAEHPERDCKLLRQSGRERATPCVWGSRTPQVTLY